MFSPFIILVLQFVALFISARIKLLLFKVTVQAKNNNAPTIEPMMMTILIITIEPFLLLQNETFLNPIDICIGQLLFQSCMF